MGIAVFESNFSLPSLPSFSEAQSYVDTKIRDASQLFCDHVVYPAGVGVVAGLTDFGFCTVLITIESLLSSVGIELINAGEEEAFDILESILACSLVPVVEEVLFRVMIQGSIKWVAAQILPDTEIDVWGFVKLPLPALVAIVATSILFGALHYSNGGMLIVFAAAVAGVNFGILKEKVGFISSCTAHAVTNTLITAAEIYSG